MAAKKTSSADVAATYAVGIDLGTTNCGIASLPLGEEHALAPHAFAVAQLVNAGEVGERALLPSFVYVPAETDLPAGSLSLPWDASRAFAVGALARDRGASVPARLVSSAKSWLSFAGVDRRAAILPWGAPDEVPKLSPVAASARYLSHLREAWNQAHPEAPLESQELAITVPASFDAVARDLTVEAAEAAGLGGRLTLLEEPQAALYSWLAGHGASWRKQVEPGDVILVCDVGGGTTDFSLIAVGEEGGTLVLDRLAVGDHILLGGDNMDMALAYAVRTKLEGQGKHLDDWQFRSLAYGCRVAKEALLENPQAATHPLVVPGRGSKLVGGTIRTELTREELDATLLDGFFPRIDAGERPAKPRRTGLTTLGLPYAADPGITRHLAAFLGFENRSRESLAGKVSLEGKRFLQPTALLFNGGVMRSTLLRERITAILDGWLTADSGKPVKVLVGDDPDLAVARGAAYYGWVRRGKGIRIRGGTARAYYVGIERAELAVPGVPPRIDAVCVAPFGMEEGSEVELPLALGLVVGEPAAFRFFGSSTRRDDAVATVVSNAAELEELPAIETELEGESGRVVPVKLHARVTEVGTLELSAVEETSQRRWKLHFNVRVE